MSDAATLYNPISQAERKQRRMLGDGWYDTDQEEIRQLRYEGSALNPIAVHHRRALQAERADWDWAEIVADLDGTLRDGDAVGGVTFRGPVRERTIDLVRELLKGAGGGRGLTAKVAAQAVGRTKRACDAALNELVLEGSAYLEKQATRGSGSKRKVYRTYDPMACVTPAAHVRPDATP